MNQTIYTVAIGGYAGNNNQYPYAIAIGYQAGQSIQGTNTISIGKYAGQTNQSNYAIAMGYQAGQITQGDYSIAIGNNCGQNSQALNSIAIGNYAGQYSQGTYAIAIGSLAGQTNQPANSIVLNASGNKLTQVSNSGLFINPISNTASSSMSNMLCYNPTTCEIQYNTTSKTFVIDHPNDKERYLVHACLEGPEVGVYYRGKSEIINNECITIELPDYVCKLANDFNIQITPIYSGKKNRELLYTSEVIDNKFTVYGSNGKFYWLIHGKRCDIETEPLKNITNVKGTGPYKWI